MSRALESVRRHAAEGCNDQCRPMPSDEWWCEARQEWSWCPGPCSDGTPHGPKRTVDVFMHHLLPGEPTP